MYYLDREYILREHRYTERKGWFAGDIGNMGIRPSTNTHIGAIQYSDRLGGVHIRVYYQGEHCLSLKRYPIIETPRRGRISGYRGIMP